MMGMEVEDACSLGTDCAGSQATFPSSSTPTLGGHFGAACRTTFPTHCETTSVVVEICQRKQSRATHAEVRRHVLSTVFCLSEAQCEGETVAGAFFLDTQIGAAFARKNSLASVALGACAAMRGEDARILNELGDDPFLSKHIAFVRLSAESRLPKSDVQRIDATSGEGPFFSQRIVQYRTFVYQLNDDGPADELTLAEGEGEGSDGAMTAASHWLLPAAEFEGTWESLIYDDSEIKNGLLRYASTAILFSDKRVDSNVVSWNGVILLHGPPGTGKTSLCKKLSVRLGHRYSHGQLIEINSHSLFSRWFSESGKLVTKMFQRIQAFVEDPTALVFVLIDEVESLTAARKSVANGAEPSDAIRVVNAVLTQIDGLKRYKNVIILATSNVTGNIDLAFIDRADIKQFIGHPSARAIYEMYRACLAELMRVGIVAPEQTLLDLNTLELMGFPLNDSNKAAVKLYEIAKKSEGLSGRAIKKIPFIAHALYIGRPVVSVDEFLSALEQAALRQLRDRDDLSK